MQGTSLKRLIESHGAAGFYQKMCELLNEKQVSPDEFSYYELADACGVLAHLQTLRERDPGAAVTQLLSEANPGVGTNLLPSEGFTIAAISALKAAAARCIALLMARPPTTSWWKATRPLNVSTQRPSCRSTKTPWPVARGLSPNRWCKNARTSACANVRQSRRL